MIWYSVWMFPSPVASLTVSDTRQVVPSVKVALTSAFSVPLEPTGVVTPGSCHPSGTFRVHFPLSTPQVSAVPGKICRPRSRAAGTCVTRGLGGLAARGAGQRAGRCRLQATRSRRGSARRRAARAVVPGRPSPAIRPSHCCWRQGSPDACHEREGWQSIGNFSRNSDLSRHLLSHIKLPKDCHLAALDGMPYPWRGRGGEREGERKLRCLSRIKRSSGAVASRLIGQPPGQFFGDQRSVPASGSSAGRRGYPAGEGLL